MKRYLVQQRGPRRWVVVDTTRVDASGEWIVEEPLCVSRAIALVVAATWERRTRAAGERGAA